MEATMSGGLSSVALTDAVEPQTAKDIRTFNLIYHIAPFSRNDAWRKNVRQLLRRMHVFNGKRVVAIATGQGLDAPELVQQEFTGHNVTFITRPNDFRLREVATFLPLLEAVCSTADDEATFYAHAKGVASGGDPKAVTYWRNSMYHALLDDLPKIKAALADHPCVGTHRRHHPTGRYPEFGNIPVFPDGNADSTWHFAGTFFWFRNRDVFSHPRWREIRPTGYFAEAYLSMLFSYEQSCCVLMDNPSDPYDAGTYPEKIPDPPAEADQPLAPRTARPLLRVELGGGRYPRGEGFLNVDQPDCPSVDLPVDFEKLGRDGCRLPFDDDSVDEIFSSHCLEHVWPYDGLLHEIARVCKLGAPVEIRVPHWNQQMAMCNDHKHTVSPDQVDHWSKTALDFWWGGCRKRLELLRTEWIASAYFAEAKGLFPHLTDEQVMRFIPSTCHENRFHFTVIENK
jgi:ubiquinone/menaquinone biosynthesis C-methylase UbiE